MAAVSDNKSTNEALATSDEKKSETPTPIQQTQPAPAPNLNPTPSGDQKPTASPQELFNALDLTLSPAVQAKIREVIPSEDPLDCADFDAIAYVNSLFPSEESLGDVR